MFRCRSKNKHVTILEFEKMIAEELAVKASADPLALIQEFQSNNQAIKSEVGGAMGEFGGVPDPNKKQ